MEPNNFEKNIQRKLDELKIPPSDSVWGIVEKKIAKKKKDRRMIFILFFLILLLLSGGYWLFNSTEHHSPLQNSQLIRAEQKDSKPTNNPDSSLKKTSVLSGNSISEKNDSSNVLDVKTRTPLLKIKIQNKTPANKNQKNISTKSPVAKKDEIIYSSQKEKASDKKRIDMGMENKTQDQNNLAEKESGADDVKAKNSNSDSGIIAENKIIADTLLKNKIEQLITKKDSSSKKPSEDLQKHKWKFGITFSGGKSMIGEAPLGINNLNNNYVQSMPATGPVNTPPVYPPSELRGSVAFIGGVFVEKNISERNKISLGISYKYFSLLNKVGNRIDSLITFPQLYSIASDNLFNSANNAHTYRNNFHYLEIPVSLKLQLGNSKTVPLYWDAGINISQLISSNALQYQSGTGIYYNDNSLFNKTQIGLQTGLSLTLFSKKKNLFTIGPYFLYNISRAADRGVYDKKHFSFIGIRTGILFKEK